MTTTSDITQTNPETSGTIKTNLAHSQRSNEKLPRYREGDNLQTFFKLYELTANLNGWETCQEKLAHVHNSFKGKLLEWVIHQSWETWEDFKTSLMERQEVATKDDMYYLTKLLHTKRKNFATLNKFIIKFDSLMQARRNIQSQNQQVVTDLDPFYMKLFIKNSSPAEMRRYLKEKPSTKLSEMYKLARSFEDEDSSDEDDSDSESDSNSSKIGGSSDSDSDSNHRKSGKSKARKHSMVKSALPKVKTKEPSFKSALLAVLDNQQQQQQQFLLLLQQQTITPSAPVHQPRMVHHSYKCYNCKEPGHYDDQCPKPCKHCGSYEHKRYSCPHKPFHMGNNNAHRGNRRVDVPNQDNSNNHNTNTNTNTPTNTSNPSLFMSVSDDIIDQQALATFGDTDVLAIKRLRSEEQQSKELKASKRAKKKMDEQAARTERLKAIYENLSANNPIDPGSSITDPGPSSNVAIPSTSTVEPSASAIAPASEPREVEETEIPPVEDTTISEDRKSVV